jgi:hypothetical protein
MTQSAICGGMVGCMVASGTLASSPPTFRYELVDSGYYAQTSSPSGTSAGYTYRSSNEPSQIGVGVFAESLENLGSPDEGQFFFVNGVNDAGDVAGSFRAAETDLQELPSVLSPSRGRVILPTPGNRQGFATDISSSGVAVGGVFEVTGQVPTRWTRVGDSYQHERLALPGPEWQGLAQSVSASGMVGGGVYRDADWLPAMWTSNDLNLLELPDGFSRGAVQNVVSDSLAIGFVWNSEMAEDARVAVWTSGIVQVLPDAGGPVLLGDSNAQGQIVATRTYEGLYLHKGQWFDLRSLLESPDSLHIIQVIGIDDLGRVLVIGSTTSGDIAGTFRLTIVPAPGAIALVLAGVIVAGRRRR